MTGRWMRRIAAATVMAVVLTIAGVGNGTAWANNSNGGHWLRAQGAARAQVYFIDFTPSRWPVSEVVPDWNPTIALDVYYRWQTCPGSFYGHCVEVREYYNSTDGYRGYARVTIDGNGHFVDGATKTYVRLNSYYSAWFPHDKQVTCQELGHAIGLDHQIAATCMNNKTMPINDNAYQHPNSHDYDMIRSIYNH